MLIMKTADGDSGLTNYARSTNNSTSKTGIVDRGFTGGTASEAISSTIARVFLNRNKIMSQMISLEETCAQKIPGSKYGELHAGGT